MTRETAILITLIVYQLLLVLIGLTASRRTHDNTDFYLGGRGLGPLVAAISASASSSSAWTLLGVSGFAYAFGLSALWIFPSCVGGFMVNWYLLASRLRRTAIERGAITTTEILAGPPGTPWRRTVAWLASLIILFSLTFYVAAQFDASGKAFSETFDLPKKTSILVGSAIIVFYTLAGGFWAVSLTDTLQGLVMAATAILLPAAALIATDGPLQMIERLGTVPVDGFTSLTRHGPLAASLGLILGLLGIGLGYPGQPHVVNRFMAIGEERAVARARRYSIAWAVVVYAGMIVLGLCGRVLFDGIADPEKVFITAANELFHPVLAGIMLAGVLSAIMSTADSQLLVAGSAVSHDLCSFRKTSRLLLSRAVVLLLSVVALLLAFKGDRGIWSKVLFAWSAMGAAFGPLLLVTVWRGPVPPRATMLAMVLGFATSVTAYLTPSIKSGVTERVVPFVLALAIAWWGRRGAERRTAAANTRSRESSGAPRTLAR